MSEVVLAEECYGVNPANNEVVMIKRGHVGFIRHEGVQYSTPDLAMGISRKMNALIGVDMYQAKAMEYGALFGWNSPAADFDRFISKVEPKYKGHYPEYELGRRVFANSSYVNEMWNVKEVSGYIVELIADLGTNTSVIVRFPSLSMSTDVPIRELFLYGNPIDWEMSIVGRAAHLKVIEEDNMYLNNVKGEVVSHNKADDQIWFKYIDPITEEFTQVSVSSYDIHLV